MPIKSEAERPATELNPEKQVSRVTVQGGETTENKPAAEQNPPKEGQFQWDKEAQNMPQQHSLYTYRFTFNFKHSTKLL